MTTAERIATLEARLDALAEANEEVTRQLAQAHLDQWQARIDDIEVQVHLAKLDTTDRVKDLTTDLHHRWNKVRRQLADASTTTSAVAETLQTGLDKAYRDLRDAVMASRERLS